jgi:hypothetical protein
MTLVLMTVGLMVSMAMAHEGGTRISFSAGADYPIPTDIPRFDGPSLRLQATVDAPPSIRRHVPLEAVLSFSGPYADRGTYVIVSPVTPADPRYSVYRQGYFEPRYSASAAVRIYTAGHKSDRVTPNGLEAGLGLGVHQFVTDQSSWYTGERIHTQYDVQFRASGFVRMYFQPTRPQGIFLEMDVQRALEDHHQTYLPIASVMATLGYRFRI